MDLVKSVIKLLNPDFGFELYTYSDVPPGSGLGGSAVLLSAIIGSFNNFRENKFNDYDLWLSRPNQDALHVQPYQIASTVYP